MEDYYRLKKGESVWFAMAAPQMREISVTDELKKKGIEAFVPRKLAVWRKCNGKKYVREVPSIANMFFIRTDKATLLTLKGTYSLQFLTFMEGENRKPIIVPDDQMDSFIKVCEVMGGDVRFVEPEDLNLTKGTLVRVIGGPFDGIIGTYVKVKGIRNRRVVLRIECLANLLLAEIQPDLIEVIR